MWKTKSAFDTIPPSFPPFLRYLVLPSPLLSSLCRCHLRLIPVCHLFLLGSRWGHYHCVGPPFGSKTLRLNLWRRGWISWFVLFFLRAEITFSLPERGCCCLADNPVEGGWLHVTYGALFPAWLLVINLLSVEERNAKIIYLCKKEAKFLRSRISYSLWIGS